MSNTNYQKYKIQNINIPQEKRQDINNKCLYVIDNNLTALSQNDIFNAYSGDGGLHGLKYNDYDNFYKYSEAKRDIEHGQFFTPHHISKFIVDCVKPSKTCITADLTCGMGNFFNYLPNEENVYGCELDMKAYKVAKYLYPKANITNDDIRIFDPKVKFDIIFGNPPFNLKWSVGKDEYLSQLYYFIKSSELLKPSGILALIVPNSFINDEFICKGMISEINERFNFVCQFALPSDSFKNVGVSNFETKIMIFQKHSEHITKRDYKNQYISISAITEQQADIINNTYVKPLVEQKEKIKSKLFFENLHNNDNTEHQEFAFKVKKLIYDIKRNPKTNSKYAKCLEYVNQFYTQKKPDNIEYKEWEKVRITKNKVIAYLTKALKSQNHIEKDIIRLVKTKYTLKLKAYSHKTKLQLSKMETSKEISLNDAVIYNQYPFVDKTYKKLINKKRKVYEQQTQSYSTMTEDQNIKLFLDNLVINDTLNEKLIKLNEIQSSDTNKALQKNYSFLQWERGCGKTITGTAQALYRQKHNNINNVIVIAPSIAIKGTWQESLESFKIPFILINKLDDLNKIEKGQMVLMTLYTINKYRKQIKKLLKINNKKYMMIFDESDAITNLSSQAYKSVLDCFRRLVKYKLLLTGTSTRNNINEFFGQLELLYNNSVNMLSETQTIFYEDRKEKTIREMSNDHYMKPIPAYKKGHKLFKQMFSPEKITVFGIGQNNQDIYNSEELKGLLSYTIITRTFKEVTGREGYKIHQELCEFNKHERDVYNTIINEFYEIEREYFSSTGNSRKDSMLKALHQLNLLLQACARFHTFKQYKGSDISTKFVNVIKDLSRMSNERVAIGCITKKSVWEYQAQIQKYFPKRKVIAFTGEDLSIYQRKAIIKELKEYDNVILITTQQSLSCSLNIGFIDNIIIPELQWNDARMGQYYFRFIRYDSTKDKNVYIYTYRNSIESNLMQLVMVKEKINLFMKDQDLNDEEIQEKYGINFDIMNMLLKKEQDEEGKFYIKWGEQQII